MDDSSTDGAPSASKKRRFEAIDDAAAPDNLAAGGLAGPEAADLSFDDLLDQGDWEEEEKGDDGLLQDEQDRAAEYILSSSKGDARRAAAATGGGKDAMLVDDGITANNEDTQMKNAGAQDTNDHDEEEEDYSAQEAALLAKYGSALANFGLLQQASPPPDEPVTPGFSRTSSFIPGAGAGAGASFTSARGSKLAPPSEAALNKARELHNSPPEQEHGGSTTSAVRLGAPTAAGDDSGFVGRAVDTPVHSRIARLGGSAGGGGHGKQAIPTTIGRPSTTLGSSAGPKAFKPPSSVKLPGAHAVGKDGAPHHQQQQQQRPTVVPLRFGPKGKVSLLPPKVVQMQPIHSTMDVLQQQNQLDTPSKSASSSSTAFGGFTSGSGKHVAMPSKEEAEARMARLEAGNEAMEKAGESCMQIDEQRAGDDLAPKAFGGLTNGSGKAIAGPSEEAIARVDARLSANGQNKEQVEVAEKDRPAAPFAGLTSGSGKAIAGPSKAAIARVNARLSANAGSTLAANSEDVEMDAQELDVLPAVVPWAGLTNGSGKAIAGPSKEAIAKVNARLSGDAGRVSEQTSDTIMDQDAAPAPAFAGLTSGSGKAVAGPSAEALARITARLDGVVREDPAPAPVGGGFTTGGGAAVTMPSNEAIDRAMSNLDNRPSTPARLPLADKTNFEAQQFAGSPSFASAGSGNPGRFHSPIIEGNLKKPFRMPGRTNGLVSTPARGLSSPGIGSPRLGPNGSPQVNLAMTQRNTASGAINKSTFKCPFKGGKRPTDDQFKAFATQTKAKTLEPGTMVGTVPKDVEKDLAKEKEKWKEKQVRTVGLARKRPMERGKDSVFDLYTPVVRKGMAEYGLNPGWRTKDLVEANLPKELIFLTYAKCEEYKFFDKFGYAAAFNEVHKYGGCELINLDWVRHHYGLIVWKLAGIARAKTDEWKSFFTFHTVCNQLKYRYEREFLLSQRSCIKRIQERDSSAAIPMCLVVTQIFYEEREVAPEIGSEAEQQGIMSKEMWPSQLELSDGWYKIKANLDPVLEQAVMMRNLVSGTKILIQGAKLEGNSDGEEPLKAYESSTLAISGNASCRAAWDTKLGFRKGRYICSFRSLRPDGGVVPYIDIVVTNTYAIGYKGAYVEGAGQEMWNEKEEIEKQKEYDKQREMAHHTAQTECQKRVHKLQEIQQVLRVHAENSRKTAVKSEGIPGLSDFSDVFEKLDEDFAKGKIVLKTLSKDLLQETFEYATRQLEAFTNDANETMRRKLDDLCPPRVAKPFQLIRVKDYHDRDPDVNRTCLLNIPDPAHLGEGFLGQGKRYLISNLVPGRTQSWARRDIHDGEIYLTVRYDSKWQPMPM